MPSPKPPKTFAPPPPKVLTKRKAKKKNETKRIKSKPKSKKKRIKLKKKPKSNQNIKKKAKQSSKVEKPTTKRLRLKNVKSSPPPSSINPYKPKNGSCNKLKPNQTDQKKNRFPIRLNPKLFQQYKFNKENNPQTAKTKQTKNLKPSLVKKIKKSPPNNTKPNKLQFNYNLFKKQKSADTIPSDVKTPNLTFSKSADITNNSTQKLKYSLPDLFCFKKHKSKSKSMMLSPSITDEIFNVNDTNEKKHKPEDYNEIQFKAVDPMESRRRQKKQSGERFTRQNIIVTNYSSNNIKTMRKPTANPILPSLPPPKPKEKEKQKAKTKQGNASVLKQGVLEVMPSKEANGWIYTASGMFRVNGEAINDIKQNNIFEGSPVLFDSIDKNAKHLRLLKQIDIDAVKHCLTEKGKTRYDAHYYVYGTQFEPNGNLDCNAFAMITGECDGAQLADMSEKIINAFINTNGGTLYIGIDKAWNVKGVSSKDIDLDRIKQFVMMNVNRFEPKLSENDLRKFIFTTTAIVTLDGVLCENIIIIKLVVPKPFKNDNNDTITYSTGNGDKFRKNLNYITKVIM